MILHSRSKTENELNFSLVGVSAGAHLCMMYGYSLDRGKVVKAIVNIVGPVYLTSLLDLTSEFHNDIIRNFVGGQDYWQDPGHHYRCSPLAWVGSTSPPTLSFYGQDDWIVPTRHGTLLKNRLNEAGVANAIALYPGGHADWDQLYQQDMYRRIIAFLNQHF